VGDRAGQPQRSDLGHADCRCGIAPVDLQAILMHDPQVGLNDRHGGDARHREFLARAIDLHDQARTILAFDAGLAIIEGEFIARHLADL